ncbi:hypothetical protein ACFFJO_28600, partial [Paenibacillus sepulcri]
MHRGLELRICAPARFPRLATPIPIDAAPVSRFFLGGDTISFAPDERRIAPTRFPPLTTLIPFAAAPVSRFFLGGEPFAPDERRIGAAARFPRLATPIP